MAYGPIVRPDGSQCWYDDFGDHHRDDGPAVITPENGELYYHHGILHRLDGPAMMIYYPQIDACDHRYFIHGKEYSKKEFEFWSKCHETNA